ncbi:hypothetical protein [Streptomyces sp. CC208A]|uniref:hypothetical protein n=1 Tax=Streptomyces sp. CC208A TaxID=3044573 RepID=UPI0024A9B88D|nr:hypothetical protein [Streptomyces sp. CC208A]
MSEATRGNRHLKRARQRVHLTQEQNADKLTKLAATMYEAGELTKRTSVSPRQYRRWESATPPWPHPDHRKLLERFYGRSIHELGFTPPGDVPPSTLTVAEPVPVLPAARTEVETHDLVNRRKLLTTGAAALGMTATGAGLPWLSRTAAAAPGDGDLRVTGDDVDLLRDAAHDLDAIDQRFGGDRLWRGARNQLMWLHHLIDEGIYTDPVGQELHAIAGQLTTSLGWFCYDADRQTEARVYFSEALNTAMLSGDDALATRTLSNMARQSVDLGKAREAIRFARIAQAHATEWSAPPRVGALLAIREAQGHARLGDEISAGNAIKRAWQHFEHGTSQRDPDWTVFLNEAELTCLEGMCRLDLGQHRQAVRILDQSARLQDIEHSRNLGMCLARLAYAALQGRDLDHSVHAVSESLRLVEGGMTSTRNMKQLTLVRNGLSLHQAHAPAREMVERLTEYTA